MSDVVSKGKALIFGASTGSFNVKSGAVRGKRKRGSQERCPPVTGTLKD